MNIHERKRQFVETIAKLHDEHERRIAPGYQKKKTIWNKYSSRLQAERNPWSLKPADFMSVDDAAAYEDLAREEKAFSQRVSEVTREVLQTLVLDPATQWERVPSGGVPGSLAQTNSRMYRTQIDPQYSLQLNWYNYPPDFGAPRETYRESYSTSIVGSREEVTHKGFGGFGRKTERQNFPLNTLGITADETGQFKPSRELQEAFEGSTREAFQQDLLSVGTGLKAELG